MVSQLINSFNAGLLTPQMDARTDLEKYSAGCRYLQNFLITAYGGVRKRGGFEFINACVTDGKRSRLVPFQVSKDRSYILEFAENTIRFFRDGARIVDGGGEPVEVISPYSEDDLRLVQWAQVNDVLFLVHPNHFPRRLSRLSDTNWTLAEEAFLDAPFLDENIVEASTVTASGVTGAQTLTASQPIFTAEMVGSTWQIAHDRAPGDFEISIGLSAPSTSAGTLKIQGTWGLITTGTWAGTIKIQRRKIGAATWLDYRTYTAANDRNIAPSETEDDLMEYRLSYTGGSTGVASATLQARTGIIRGVVKITGYTSPTVVSVQIIRDLYATTATYRWSAGAWSEEAGYPAAIAFFGNRVIYAGTYAEPQAGWASATNNYTRFIRGTLDTDSFKFTLATTERSEIISMVSDRRLLIFTTNSEWILKPTSNSGVLTPAAQPEQQSSIGSEPIPARMVNSSIVFVDDGARRLLKYGYDYNSDKYKEEDLTLVGEQVTRGGIKELAFMRRPDPILWACTGEGKLMGFTYMESQNVAGWHPHEVGGFVESVQVIRTERTENELWITARYLINGNVKRYILRMFPDSKDVQEREAAADYVYLDLCKTFVGSGDETMTLVAGGLPEFELEMTPAASGAETTAAWQSFAGSTVPAMGYALRLVRVKSGEVYSWTLTGYSSSTPAMIWTGQSSSADVSTVIEWELVLGGGTPPEFMFISGRISELTGLGHLEGETVTMLADGFVLADRQVTLGAVDLGGRSYKKVTVGKRVRSAVQPMTLELMSGAGTSRGKIGRISEINLNVWKTIGGRYCENPNDPTPDTIRYRDSVANMNTPTPAYTGEHTLTFNVGYTRTPRVCIIHDDPLPCSILAIIADWSYSRR